MMNIQLRFLLAYSPFLNPIEKMFSVLKKELREDSICNRIATVPALIGFSGQNRQKRNHVSYIAGNFAAKMAFFTLISSKFATC